MIALAISLTECQEALSERQFEKQTRDTLYGADVRAQSIGINSYTYRGVYRFFSGIFPSKIKFNHSVLCSDEGRLWRLLCSLVHPKTQHL